MNLKIKEVLHVKIVYRILPFANPNPGLRELPEPRSSKEAHTT